MFICTNNWPYTCTHISIFDLWLTKYSNVWLYTCTHIDHIQAVETTWTSLLSRRPQGPAACSPPPPPTGSAAPSSPSHPPLATPPSAPSRSPSRSGSTSMLTTPSVTLVTLLQRGTPARMTSPLELPRWVFQKYFSFKFWKYFRWVHCENIWLLYRWELGTATAASIWLTGRTPAELLGQFLLHPWWLSIYFIILYLYLFDRSEF